MISQLTDVYRDGSLVSHYDYDSNGNRIGGTYDDQDRMLSYGGNTYEYSANGELKSKTGADGKTVYSYDVLGNLRAVELANGTKIEYVIDGQNRRIGKKVNGTLVQGFLYQDGLNPVAELDANGNVVARFVYGTRSNVPDYVVKGGVTYRVITDNLGSPRVILNVTTGELAQRIDYNEWGQITQDTNPGFTPFAFAGGLYDQDTRLLRFGVRDYDPEVGRWTCKDPAKFAGGDTDLYAYCANDPVNLIDETGFHATWPSYIPFFGFGYTLGEGIDHAITGECIDWDEWQERLMWSTMNTVAAGDIMLAMGLNGGERIGPSKGSPSACFTEDTLILTENGQRQIKEIKVGDLVYSENPQTGEKGLKKVTNVFVRETSVLVHVFVGDLKIRTTMEHPFWVIGKGWVGAGELAVGEKVLLYSGKVEEVKDVKVEQLKEPIKVYNFKVEDWHTYFVTENSILVHNACLPSKNVVKQNGVSIEHYYPNDHGNPVHLHVKGGGPSTKIGPQGLPVNGQPQLTPKQAQVVVNNINTIKSTIKIIQRWLRGI